MSGQEQKYTKALGGKDIPILPLDHKWTLLFPQDRMSDRMKDLSFELKELLKRRGQLGEDMKKVKQLKRSLLADVPDLHSKLLSSPEDVSLQKELNDHSRLIDECNEKLTAFEDEMLEIPQAIYQTNYDLMMESMVICYEKLHRNSMSIEKIDVWLDTIREELKEKIIAKQESEDENFNLYSYMHQIFGMEVIDLFDMKYDPEKKHPIRTPNVDSKRPMIEGDL